jgi:tripartite-type tricarboxylate transporter receptor subunit TctC
MTTRRHLFSLLALSVAMALPQAAVAQAFPSKAIRLVVPFGAGGVAD